MNQTVALILWLVVSLALGIAVLIKKNRATPRKSLPSAEKFVGMGLAVAGVIVFVEVIYKVLTVPELQKLLEWDGMIALCVGAGFGLYLAIKEIIKLFTEDEA